MTKKVLLPLLLLLSLLLTGCGGGKAVPVSVSVTFTPQPTATAVPTPTTEPTETPRPTAAVHQSAVPVLMYHVVAAPEENDLYLSPEDFQSQLDWLEEHGFTPITMQELVRHWQTNDPIPEKPIVLTFDDGYISMYNEVYPRLMEKGWAATFYIVPLYAGDAASFVPADKLREMADAGMEIGSHTYSHAQLTEYDTGSIEWELSESKRVLEEWLGREVVSFCYPSGRYTPEIAGLVSLAGYSSAVTTEYGIAEESRGMYAVSRIRISAYTNGTKLGNILKNSGFE